MIKIAALNEESEEESGSEEEVTREALEQIALQQYAKALNLQKKGNIAAALQLLKDLLDTEILYNVQKPAPGDKVNNPLFNLKYLCFKNVAAMQSTTGEVENAIESYISASELDDSDVTLWHRLGQLCLRAKRYETALQSFQKGTDCNPRHWPCIDKKVTLLLGLEYYEECIAVIYDAFLLDPGYMRGLVYRKHIYTYYPNVRHYLLYLNKKYSWDENEDDSIDEDKASKLLTEAEEIHSSYVEQQNAEKQYSLPKLKLEKPITSSTWLSIGESLVHMHKYITEKSFSHASALELVFDKEPKDVPMEVCEEIKKTESSESKSDDNLEIDKTPIENGTEIEANDLSDKEKVTTDNEKVESDIEMTNIETTDLQQQNGESKELKKLQQWEWCKKRRSGRKVPVAKDTSDNIYDILRKMVPFDLVPVVVERKESEKRQPSPDLSELNRLYEEKSPGDSKEENMSNTQNYFGSESEQKDAELFLLKYTENEKDIIHMLREYLEILSNKWQVKWSENLIKIFIEANMCYSQHVEIPSCCDENKQELIYYAMVQTLAEEFSVNEKLNSDNSEKQSHNLCASDIISYTLTSKPHFFVENCLELLFRILWTKLHIHLINKNEEFALDCLYQLLHEIQAMGELDEPYELEVINFSFKPKINEQEIAAYIKFLERNKCLSTVPGLYSSGYHEEVLSILLDSFEHSKDLVRQQEDEMSLEFSVQLTTILDSFWALKKIDECFKWSLTCLHEALKHFFHFTSGSADYQKWSIAVVKILGSMERIFMTEGSSCLDMVSQKELSQGLEDIIRITGHQVETSASEMPLNTVAPWIIMHYIFQREEDQGRGKYETHEENIHNEETPNSLMILFLGHDQIGSRGWCCSNDSKLLYFTLDTVIPRLHAPYLAKSLENILQHMEQCVYCLFGYPGKKNKVKYLKDHNVTPQTLDWIRAQQVYEIFRPLTLPILTGKVSAITADTENFFFRVLELLPQRSELQKYIPDLEKYMSGKENKMPVVPVVLPHKIKDIYFLFGDYYFKREDCQLSIKYNMFDILLNNNRFLSWAQMTLSKQIQLESILNLGNNINYEKDFMRPAKTIIRCFKISLELEFNLDVCSEYGSFSYAVHSFCSRQLKQASESLSMEDFEALENQKEEMLETALKCFTTLTKELKNHHDPDKMHEGLWFSYYMLGKIAEKQNKPPAVYTQFYLKAVKSLHEADAVYPSKINYNSPQHYSIEVLELHYRIHASILKYIEQHENKPIPLPIGKVFLSTTEAWKEGPFSKKSKKNVTAVHEMDIKSTDHTTQAANILKRSISDAGEEETPEIKKLKLESAAAKVRRSASYDTERLGVKDSTTSEKKSDVCNTVENRDPPLAEPDKPAENEQAHLENNCEKEQKTEQIIIPSPNIDKITFECSTFETNMAENRKDDVCVKENNEERAESKDLIENCKETIENCKVTSDISNAISENGNANLENGKTALKVDKDTMDCSQNIKDVKENTSSSSSSSDSSSTENSSDSSSDSSDSGSSSKSSDEQAFASEELISKLISLCLEALEDCVSRFPLHYKALYRIAHYHFYYKKGKDIEKCRDVMLSSFTLKSNGNKMSGLFGERKSTNFFNNIWRIPVTEVDRPGGFAIHMNRCVLLTMEILKQIDDYKTLLDMSLHLQKTPDQDKKYLRDSDRLELSQQALSLCIQSLKGQIQNFSQQSDLKSNEVERKVFNCLMLDIYKSYTRVQKQPCSKQFVNLLIDGYKLITTINITENTNLVDLSMKYCQGLKQQQLHLQLSSSMEKKETGQRKQFKQVNAMATTNNTAETTKPAPVMTTETVKPVSVPATVNKSKVEPIKVVKEPIIQKPVSQQPPPPPPPPAAPTQPKIPKMSSKEVANAFQNYFPLLNDPVMSQQTAAALSYNYINSLNALTNYSALQNSYQSTMKQSMTSLQNSFQAEFYRQFLGQSFSSFNMPQPKKPQKRGPKPGSSKSYVPTSVSSLNQAKPTSKSFSASSNVSKQSSVTNLHKTMSTPLAPSMGTVLPTLPASLTASLTPSYVQSSMSLSSSNFAPRMSTSSTNNPAAHKSSTHQTNSGKTLQEKLAERQKGLPSSKSSTSQSITHSLSRLPSSLTVTKAPVYKAPTQSRKDPKKPDMPPKPIATDEVIVLDDD